MPASSWVTGSNAPHRPLGSGQANDNTDFEQEIADAPACQVLLVEQHTSEREAAIQPICHGDTAQVRSPLGTDQPIAAE